MPGGPRLSREQAERRVVAGDPSVVDDENYRTQFGTLPEARAYVADTGLIGTDLWAIVSVPRKVRKGEAARWSPRRSGLDKLSRAQEARYRASQTAQAEAEAHGVSLETWYRVAPDLRSFRGHAPERQRRPGESIEHWEDRLVATIQSDFAVYIAREYEGKPPDERREMSELVKAAWRARREAA